MYDLDKGVPQLDPATNQPVSRSGAPVPCEYGPRGTGCPKGHYDDPNGLWEINRKVVAHYRRCKHLGEIPNDSTVRHNYVILAELDAGYPTQYEKSMIKLMSELGAVMIKIANRR